VKVNYDLVDVKRVDPEKYIETLGCEECKFFISTTVNDDYFENLRYTKDQIFFYDSEVTLQSYPSKTEFALIGDSITIFIRDNMSNFNLPETESVHIYSDSTITLFDSTKLKGDFQYNKGEIYVENYMKSSFFINDIEIEHKSLFYVHASGDSSQCDIFVGCLVIDNENKYFYMNSGGYESTTITFNENNPILNIESDDTLEFIVSKTFELEIENRDEQGLIPQVTYTHSQISDLQIYNDCTQIDLQKDTYYSNICRDELKTSVPFSLTAVNQMYDDLLNDDSLIIGEEGWIYELDGERSNHMNDFVTFGTYNEPKKLVFSNYNEFGFMHPDQFFDTLQSEYGFAPLGIISERIEFNNHNYEYFLDQYESYIPKQGIKYFYEDKMVILPNEKTEIPAFAIKHLMEGLFSLPHGIRDSVNGIELMDKEKFKKLSPENAAAWTYYDRVIRLNQNILDYDILYHEAAHDLHIKYKELYEKYSTENAMLSVWGDTNFLLPYTEKDSQLIFENEWLTTSPNYQFPKAKPACDNCLPTQWEDGKRDPRNGFVTAYASNNILEDVAELAREMAKDPEYFHPLLDPLSPRYDSIIAIKVDIAKDYDFITYTNYHRATDTKNSGCDDWRNCKKYGIKQRDGSVKWIDMDTYEVTIDTSNPDWTPPPLTWP
ncbi:hypothetical protein ACFL1H_03970, partial [Nanoarchaeota archaeon]